MKKIIFLLLRYSGLPVFFREFIQRNKISILVFHDIDPKNAEITFKYLSKHYNFISLDDLMTGIYKKDVSHLPKKAMVITFDDGHVRNHELLPIFKKYQVPATIFVCSGIIDTTRHYWFLYEKNRIIQQYLKTVPTKDRLKYLNTIGFENKKEYGFQQAMSASQIADMVPFINIQSHTVFHPILTQCENEESKWEITEAKSALEEKFKIPITSIAYPNGDYTEREVRFAKEAGYHCGLTMKPGFNSIRSDPFELKRLDPNDTNDINELIVKSSGIQSILNFFK